MENIISLITSIFAIAVSIFSLIYNYIKAKKEKRVIPVISILNNAKDDIEQRFKNSNMQARVFIDEQEICQLNKQHYLYVCIYNYYEYKMINCIVNNNLSKVTKRVGVILPNKCVVIPLRIQNATKFYMEMEYKTEENETLTYKLSMDVPSFSNRQDSWFCKRKKLEDLNGGLNVSINTNELLLKTKNLNLDKKD